MIPKVHAGMEAEAGNKTGMKSCDWKTKIKELAARGNMIPGRVLRATWRVGKEDPRRVIHALKVGLSLSLVSLLYLIEPLFESIGQTAIWAVMTVVVVLEFTAGATLCKGFNRGLGTVLAGSLAFFIEYIANASDRVFRASFIGFSVFLIGAIATYMRFFPKIKKNYDYGVLIFLLTFNLITVSSYRVEHVLKIAHDRLYTIAIGCALCLAMSLLVFPNWSGEELHDSTVVKLHILAKSIDACVSEYFNDNETDEGSEKSFSEDEDSVYEVFKAVLDSKPLDEIMAKQASWEPRHSRHCYKYPWQQYVRLGAVIRSFGYTVVALRGCLRTEIQTPRSVRAVFKDPCTRVAAEVSTVLIDLGNSIRIRRHCSPELLSDNLREALHDLNAAMKSQPRLFLDPSTRNPQPQAKSPAIIRELKKGNKNHKSPRSLASQRVGVNSVEFSEALPLAAFASLLVETAARLDRVVEEVEELALIANFKEFDFASASVKVNIDQLVVPPVYQMSSDF